MVHAFSPNARRFLAFTALTAISWSNFNLTFNLYIHSMGYHQDFIGLLNGLPSVVILVLGLPIGMAADRYGYLRFLIAGSILGSLAFLGLGLSSGRLALLAFSLFGGLAGALSWVIGAPMMMAISTKEDRIFLFSVQSALMMGAGFLGSILAGAMPEILAGVLRTDAASTLPLRLSYLFGASFNVLAIIPVLGMSQVKNAGGAAKGSPVRTLPSTWAEASLFAKLLGPSALIAFGAGAMVVFFQLFFKLRFGLNPGSIGVLFAFASIVTAVATLVSPVMATRLGRQVKEGQRATLTSLHAMLGSLGRGGLGPIVSGYLQVKSGFSLAFTMTAVCYILGTLLFFAFFRNAEKPPVRGVPVVAVPGGVPPGGPATGGSPGR